MNRHPLTSADYHKDLGVTFDCSLNFHQHASELALKANRVLAYVKRAFVDLNNDVLLKLYKALVRLILEYRNVMEPTLQKEIGKSAALSAASANKLVSSLSDKLYQHRLIALDLPSLYYRSFIRDLIFLYKIINGHFKLDFSTFLLFPQCSYPRKFTETLQTIYPPPM